ncbi:MAG: D-alanyl-D-alanine carboxypeptidase [Candidatus Omnitrophica bacterium]|nr:D-alanyl-D-alanine carboxypeptidase [Candidatus Omnitrophota bacterium]
MCLLVAALLLNVDTTEAAVKPVKPADVAVHVDALSAVIMDASTGKVLFAKSPDTRLEPASTVKLMTAVLAMENLGLDDVITAPGSIKLVQPTYAGLKPGVTYKAGDLLTAMMIKSANDASVAIAEAVAGNEDEFTAMMNEKAAALGMNDTNFINSTGLPSRKKEKQYTTARDLARLMAYAMKYPFLVGEMSKKDDRISGSDGIDLYLKTHNKSLHRTGHHLMGKTGYTRKAKRTFVGVDSPTHPRIIVALLKSDSLWKDISELRTKGLILYSRQEKPGVVAEFLGAIGLRK